MAAVWSLCSHIQSLYFYFHICLFSRRDVVTGRDIWGNTNPALRVLFKSDLMKINLAPEQIYSRSLQIIVDLFLASHGGFSWHV